MRIKPFKVMIKENIRKYPKPVIFAVMEESFKEKITFKAPLKLFGGKK